MRKCPHQIYVLDTETTGLGSIPDGEKVLEVGIARVDLDRKRIYPEFNRIVHYPCLDKNLWAFQNTTLKIGDCFHSPWEVSDVARALLYYEKGIFTAYNEAFDFGQFLNYPPWDFKHGLHLSEFR